MKTFVLAIILGLLVAGCIQAPPGNNTTAIPPGYEVKDYCIKDSDCVRLNKCCDCGLGEYVNIYNQQNPECTGPRCMCPIALSKGVCQGNRCVAVAGEASEDVLLSGDVDNVSIWAGKAECGNEEKPIRTDNPDRSITIRGRISAPDPCVNLSVEVRKWPGTEGNTYTLNITTVSNGAEYCIECVGSVPYEINLTGRDAYGAYVIVYYDGRKIFPNKADFCGYSTNASCEIGDCFAQGGTYIGKVCRSGHETLNASVDELTECDDNPVAYGVLCVCYEGKCQWK